MGSNKRDDLYGNLERLRRKDADLAERVRGASSENYEITVARNGAASVVFGGIQLASAYDPQKEGEAVAAEVTSTDPDIIVAVGFGLGYHLEAIRDRCPARVIVYEPSAERMRAALTARPGLTFLTDERIAIASTPERLFGLVEGRYAPGLKMQVHFHAPTQRLAPEVIAEAVEQVSRAKDYIDITVGTRITDLRSWGRITMQNAGSIMQNPSFRELFDRFRDVPTVIVSAGPSLDKQLPLLAKYRDRLLIISIGQALGSLRSAGIEPDLVHILESKNVAHQLSRVGSAEDVNLVVTSDVDPSLFEVPVRSRFVTTAVADRVGRWIARGLGREGWTFGGSTVAHGSVALAAALGANPIMLVGQDLAYTDGRHYATSSAYDAVTVSIGDDGFSSVDSSSRARMLGSANESRPTRTRVVWVDGWGEEKVPTSPAYAGFIDGYRALAQACLMGGSEILNCTEGGARIHGLEHVRFAEALDRHAGEVVDCRGIIIRCFDEWVPPSATKFVNAVGKTDRLLQRLDNTADAGLKCCERVAREFARARSPQRQIDLLRRVGRLEKQLRGQLLTIPWIDAVVQPEIAASMADVRRSKNAQTTPERAIEEARFLFRATKSGAYRAGKLLGHCAAAVSSALPAGSDPAHRRELDRIVDRHTRNLQSLDAHAKVSAGPSGAQQGPAG